MIRKLLAGLALSASSVLTFAQTGMQYPDEMISAAISGDEAKVMEIKARADLAERPQRGDRKSARALNTKGLADLSAGNFEGAIEALTKATDADPLDAEISSNLGYAYIKKGAFDQAKSALARSINLQPGRGSAWATLAEAFARSGNIETATACLNIAYTFSQNRDKTKEFLSKVIAENADASLVTAAKAALESEGIKPLKNVKPVVTPQQGQAPAETNQQQPVAATPPAAIEPATQAAPPKEEKAPESIRSSTVAPAADKSQGESLAGKGYALPIAIIAFIIVLAGGYHFYRRKGQNKLMAEGVGLQTDTNTSNRPGIQFGKKYAIGAVALTAVVVGGYLFKDGGVTKESLAGAWNCSEGRETLVINFPSKSGDGKEKEGAFLHTTNRFNDWINQEFMPFSYSVEKDGVVMMNVRGRALRRWSDQENKWKVLDADEKKRVLFAEVPLLNKNGMVITVVEETDTSQEYLLRDRACNRIDLEKDAKILTGINGGSIDRPGLPKVASQASQQASQKGRQVPENSSDMAQQAAENYLRVNSGNGACQNIGLQMRQIAYGGGPLEGRVQVVSSMLNQASAMGCQTNW